jgi:predicted Zn-dependent protease
MFAIESEVDARVMADIKANLIDTKTPDPRSYYDGALYYYDTERDSKLALTWITKAIAANEKSHYWMWYLKAQLLARTNNKSEAITTAKKAAELAKAADNLDYVRLNEQLIASLK